MMNTHTHTPGNWKADGCTIYGGETLLAATYCEGNRELHSLDEKDTLPDSNDGQLGHGWKEALKNARLIAAAPELLAAAVELRDFLQTLAGEVQIPSSLYLQGKRAMDAAELAFSKVKGGDA